MSIKPSIRLCLASIFFKFCRQIDLQNMHNWINIKLLNGKSAIDLSRQTSSIPGYGAFIFGITDIILVHRSITGATYIFYFSMVIHQVLL